MENVANGAHHVTTLNADETFILLSCCRCQKQGTSQAAAASCPPPFSICAVHWQSHDAGHAIFTYKARFNVISCTPHAMPVNLT